MDVVKPTHRQKVPLRLSTSVTLMVSIVIISVLLAVHTLFFIQISHVAQDNLKEKSFAVARTLALSPIVINGLNHQSDRNQIQAFADSISKSNELLFIVVTDMQGIRYSHPNPMMIGQHFVGDDLQPALIGEENSAINRGTLVPALRVFTPIFNAQHQQIGVVAVGVSLINIQSVIHENLWSVPWTIIFGILVGTLGTWFLVKALKKIMFGFEPYEITNLFEQRDAMLQSIKEGVIAVDTHCRITLVNHEAKRLFKQNGPLANLLLDNTSKYWPNRLNLQQVLDTGTARRDEEINFNGSILLANTVPVVVNGDIIGAIATFRDKTEISHLMQRLTGMANYADALRTQTHEFMNKLHVILGLLHMKHYTQLEDYILKTADNHQEEIGSLLFKIKSPVIAGFLLAKINRARDLGITLLISEDSRLPDTQDEQTTISLITVLGNLIENALDAMQDMPQKEINISFYHTGEVLHCEVSDNGPGITTEQQDKILHEGFSTKGSGRGIGLTLVQRSLEAVAGTLEFESEAGIHTQFFIKIPYKTSAVNHD
ncbi:sensor histidine kinase [Yersinia ruckeri]|uniref:sensor histidine kinase n=1 Tax=Yersinia ruckeri TaxID=29486 RepID=UPI0020BDA58E|nr:sensor histidine kinase [Yersinia ruckeri]MCW6525394.1 sensor histidine kinase [Yersinia ruckeri]MCW6560207.1 sensor histidine kinase [Yersinia ruckeri]UZY06101.1 sensor histidine kinase [Yersinia ruckeri]